MMSAGDAFAPLRAALEQAGIRYAVGGSWASTAFGEARFTNGVDILADFSVLNLAPFLAGLPSDFYVDPGEAAEAIRQGRPFNVIYMPAAFKFDFFPARAFPLGLTELNRAIAVSCSGLSDDPVPFVTPEDVLLAKLHWFRAGGAVSEVQWRDIRGIVRARGGTLDSEYLAQSARELRIEDLLKRALNNE